MSLNNPKPGLGFVPEYQVSSWPYLTSSIITPAGSTREIEFPGVTRWICVHNNEPAGGTNKNLSIAFSENAFKVENSNFYTLHAGEQTMRLEVKCTKIFLSASHDSLPFSVAAGYTAIDKDQFPILTASNGFEGVG